MSIRVLVVEDDALLGLDLADQLTDAGLQVIGPANSVASAIRLISEKGCDVALLDVNLGSETSEPVARTLRLQGTPFAILSGYSSAQYPREFLGAPMLNKPARPDELVAVLLKCMMKLT